MPETYAPAHCVTVTNTCSPACPTCPGGPPPAAPAVAAAAARASVTSTLVYLGWEALDGSASTAAALAALPAAVTPVLITHGAGHTDPADLAAHLWRLQQIRPVRTLYALDPAHYRAAGLDRVRAILRHLQTRGAQPHMAFALPDGQGLPPELLACEEVSRGCDLVAYPGEALWAPADDREHRRVLPAMRRGSLTTPPDHGYPLTFHALVLETTYVCNAQCAHCYTSSGPRADRRRLPVADLIRVIDQAAEQPNIDKRLHAGGGESTIYWRELLALLQHAATRGFSNGITTNGFWASTRQRTHHRLAELATAGVRRLELSLDPMHQQYIPATIATHLLHAVADYPIQLVVRVTTTRRHTAATALTRLPTTDHPRLHVVTGAAHPVGRAATTMPEQDFWRRPGLPVGACADSLHLVITPDGDAYPCCAGSELCPTLRIGNVREQSLASIMDDARRHFLLRTLVHAGPRYFAKLIQGTTLAPRLRDSYENICDLCGHLFNDPELAAAAQHIIDVQVNRLM